uniref:50S ribosomal protein L14 n=1 Tax=Nephromyces sp. ex Molgula occidentalis TaxID=2544991 RepID=A0A5C1H7X8_9APIC|nr:50S ribosomal protein L14 [Nephromyces sp. ex Molgula occidentalis]
MVKIGSTFNVVDNTGVKKLFWIGSLNSKSNLLKIGDTIIGVVQQVTTTSKFKKAQIVYAIIINLKTPLILKTGFSISFITNSVILIDKNSNPLGTRIFSLIPKLFKLKQFFKITSISCKFI